MRVLAKAELVAWASELTPSPVVAILLAGDRLSCVDEAVAVEADGEVVGVATIAPEGEQGSGEATIVAVFVKKEWRGRGLGRQLFEDAIRRCAERQLVPVRLDVLSSKARQIIETLPEELVRLIKVYDLATLTKGAMDYILDQ